MRKNIRTFMAGFMVCFILIATATSAFAAANGTTVTAMLNGSVKMMLNGREYKAKDTNGNVMLPITYEGRTYLPVRSLSEALNIPIDYDSKNDTIWIGEKKETVQIKTTNQYQDYYGTVITTDTAILKGGDKAYQWGITNNKPQSLATLGCYILPEGKYSKFAASAYLDPDVKMDLVLEIRKDSYDGAVIKSYTLSPGTTTNMEADITGVGKLCMIANVRSGHDTVNKFIIGEPVFKN